MKTYTKLFSAGLLAVGIATANAGPVLKISDEGTASANAAQSSFLGTLQPGYATDNFESYDVATDFNDQTTSFASSVGTFDVTQPAFNSPTDKCNDEGFQCGAGIAVLNDDETPFNGRFATSPSQWLDSMDAQSVKFTPNAENNAVGFFMTDPNDSGGRFSINGSDFAFSDVFGKSLGSGGLFYISLFDNEGLDSFEIHSNDPNDGYGIDDVTVGRVPEPGTLALLGLGLAGLGFSYRRRA